MSEQALISIFVILLGVIGWLSKYIINHVDKMFKDIQSELKEIKEAIQQLKTSEVLNNDHVEAINRRLDDHEKRLQHIEKSHIANIQC